MTNQFTQFVQQVSQTTSPDNWPLATRIEQNIPVYSGEQIHTGSADFTDDLRVEWARVLMDGPGIICIEKAFTDARVIDNATVLFNRIIEEEKQTNKNGADHFAKPGANDRIWNALQKHCLLDPHNYIAYYSNVVLDLAARAWLGDGYQTTAQVNRVNPGGQAQTAHRDYHLGFMSKIRMHRFPDHVHTLSPALTLQGAIAHCDMPVETGPTLYLPYSQHFTDGYRRFDEAEFQKYFIMHHVQLPLRKGDAAFFNPAVMHGAGSNVTTDTQRMANLLQISSAFGRAMEAVDRAAMVKTIYPILLESADAPLTPAQRTAVIASAAEGYAFPTNLDTDPPANGMSPETQAELLNRALADNLDPVDFNLMIDQQSAKRRA